MFGGEFLTSFVPEVGVQERMKEHGKDPLWKIKYGEHFMNLRISLIKSQSDFINLSHLVDETKFENSIIDMKSLYFRYTSNGSTLFTACDRGVVRK